MGSPSFPSWLALASLPLLLACSVAQPLRPAHTPSAHPADTAAASDASSATSPAPRAAPTPGTGGLPIGSEGAAIPESAIAPAPPPLVPPRRANGSWSQLVKAGRNALRTKNLPDAENNFSEAYGLTAAFPADDPRTTASVKNLQRVANAYLARHRMAQFERVMALLARVSEEVPSSRTPELAELFQTLAGTFTAQDRHADARDALERALAIQGERNRESDPPLVSMHAQLGMTYLALGDEPLGRYHVQLALGIAETAEGGDGPLYAQALIGKSRLERAAGKIDQAEADLRAAKAINTRYFGAGSSITAAVVRELAVLYEADGRDAEAREQYALAVSIWDGMPRERFQQAMARNDLAWFLVEIGEFRAAEEAARTALELLEAQGIEGQPLASVADTLATSLRDQKKYEEAEALYRRALEEGDSEGALPGWNTDAIASRFATLLEATGRTAEAEALRRETLRR